MSIRTSSGVKQDPTSTWHIELLKGKETTKKQRGEKMAQKAKGRSKGELPQRGSPPTGEPGGVPSRGSRTPHHCEA